MKTLLLFFIFLLISSSTQAQTVEEKGYAIAKEVEQRDTGWENSSNHMKMVLRNKQGEQSIREIRIKTLEMEGDGDKSLTIFDNPRDVKGTAFLSFSHIVAPDDQWLYMPALKRTKRISSANKSGPFMGSQFAYEDLASFELDKYGYKYLKDEVLEDRQTFVVESYPKYKNSGYTRQVIWIDQEKYVPLKVEYYDRKNALLKTLHFRRYKKYLDQYWRAHKQTMQNHQNGKSTVLTFNDYKFKVGLTDQDFNKTSLKRAR